MNYTLNSYFTEIKNDNFKKFLKKKILYYYNCTKDIYPGVIPILMDSSDIEKLSKYEYMVTLFLKGRKMLLFFIKDYYNAHKAIICDKLFNFYTVNITVSEKIYNGTLFDCEFIINEEKCVLFLNDCISLSGKNIQKIDFKNRLTIIDHFISKDIIQTCINIDTKPHFRMCDFCIFIKEYENEVKNGLLFIPDKRHVNYGIQKSYLQWVPKDKLTIDLQIFMDNDDLIFYSYNFKNKIKYAKVHYNVENGKNLIDKIKNLQFFTDNCIVEFGIQNNQLTPHMVKTDKLFPNGLRIIELILYIYNEDINLIQIII